MRYVVRMFLMGSAIMLASLPAAAQELAQRGPKTAIDGVEFITGIMDYDLSGTGQTVPLSVRASKSLSNRVALEFGVTMITPSDLATRQVVMPEAQLSYSWRFGRVRPFVSGGAGVSARTSDIFRTRWRPTFTGGGGARVQLSDSFHAIGEMRLRGLGRNFAGSTAEWLGGFGVSFR